MALDTSRIHTAAVRCREAPEISGKLSMAPTYCQVAEEFGDQLPEEAAGFSRLPNVQTGVLSKGCLRGESGRGASSVEVNPLNAELNPICHFLAILGTHPILHVSRIRVK